ncbi:histidine kinase [Halostella sp. JP-L12]|uniref:sensor histidine kinase n=1 Tax=Halostella TaxID=1843185 RepID=UPI000EF78937|nr:MULTISPECIES: ATP-binding protein [Halostella]NHN49964.1 histidine kinase [Halostella sp. JP-L12]
MSGGSIDFDTTIESCRDEVTYWHRIIPVLGVLLLVVAVVRAVITFASSGILLEAVLDLVLVGSLGIVTLYIGVWLPNTTIRPEFYPRIVLWVFGGVAVMGIVLGLRVLHPGVNVEFTFGTQAVFLAIGSIAGLGIGVREAEAMIHAQTLKEQNEELKRAEEQLEEAVTKLEASNDRLEQFAYAASHDLQEPLRMVTSFLELLDDRHGDDLDEDGEEFLEFAVDGADRMREMIESLLEYSQVGTRGDALGPVDLDAVLDDVLADLKFRMEESDAELTREPLPAVEGDERQLRQVFQNLLTNAIRYSGDEPPVIHVSAKREGERWTVSVRDEGTGIDPDEAERVFEVFQRLHSQDDQPGSGIGLALCERIVDRHGGEIWVDSEPGVGSEFSFTLSPA